jgi:hypothetical protein
MSLFNANFSSKELDELLIKWLHKPLHDGEHREWIQILSHDTRFREALCEWIKTLRKKPE